jgi:hypothetical protein
VDGPISFAGYPTTTLELPEVPQTFRIVVERPLHIKLRELRIA